MDKKQVAEILDFYNCPCDVYGVRDLSMFRDFFLDPANGTTLKRLQSRVADFALLIGAAVQIVVDNGALILRVETGKQKTFDYFSYSHNMERKQGNIALGIDPCGGFVSANLFTMPHMLVAGATGSGKSVFVHDCIVSLAINGGACFRLIDLKRVELSTYNGCNFTIGNVITDAQSAAAALIEEVNEMQARYRMMERYGVRHYSQLPKKKKLLARVIVIDELADLMLTKETRKSVENSIVRVAQLGRAAGVHLILATQRPSREVITGLIKANIPARVAFKTSSPIDSRVIGVTGADGLRGRGDCLYLGGDLDTPQRLQAFYISDNDLVEVIQQTKEKQSRRGGLFGRLFG